MRVFARVCGGGVGKVQVYCTAVEILYAPVHCCLCGGWSVEDKTPTRPCATAVGCCCRGARAQGRALSWGARLPRTWYAAGLHLNRTGRSARNTPLSMASTFIGGVGLGLGEGWLTNLRCPSLMERAAALFIAVQVEVVERHSGRGSFGGIEGRASRWQRGALRGSPHLPADVGLRLQGVAVVHHLPATDVLVGAHNAGAVRLWGGVGWGGAVLGAAARRVD